MQAARNFVAVVLGVAISLSLASLVSERSSAAVTKKDRTGYYLTPTTHTGDNALTACVSGYHMASLWEILDPSNLAYNTTLGFTRDDSGSGPPSGSPNFGSDTGWVRTGFAAHALDSQPLPNCSAYSSQQAFGTIAYLDSAPNPARMSHTPNDCDVPQRVWCIED